MKRGRAVSLLTIWVILNLLTAHFCPLDPDETYYWMYAQHLDWGYYDHPPAVALLIGLGKDILPGGAGVTLRPRTGIGGNDRHALVPTRQTRREVVVARRGARLRPTDAERVRLYRYAGRAATALYRAVPTGLSKFFAQPQRSPGGAVGANDGGVNVL